MRIWPDGQAMYLLKKSLINQMEYQYYVDQIQNQTTGTTNPLEVGLTEAAPPGEVTPDVKAELLTTEILAPSATEQESSDVPSVETVEAPTTLEANKETGADRDDRDGQSLISKPPWTDPGPAERALPLADAFSRRQHYVESLLTCCAAGRQCAVDGDPLTYLRFRAKNESIMCELTNARERFAGRVGTLSMPRTRKLDLVAHRLVTMVILWFVGGFIFSYCLAFLVAILH
ncbi:MAG: hypothetical protein C5B53_10855, partial [Candidatus Melainabacteria bacterium]